MGCICSKKASFEATPAPRPVTLVPVPVPRSAMSGAREAARLAEEGTVREGNAEPGEEVPDYMAHYRRQRWARGLTTSGSVYSSYHG